MADEQRKADEQPTPEPTNPTGPQIDKVVFAVRNMLTVVETGHFPDGADILNEWKAKAAASPEQVAGKLAEALGRAAAAIHKATVCVAALEHVGGRAAEIEVVILDSVKSLGDKKFLDENKELIAEVNEAAKRRVAKIEAEEQEAREVIGSLVDSLFGPGGPLSGGGNDLGREFGDFGNRKH